LILQNICEVKISVYICNRKQREKRNFLKQLNKQLTWRLRTNKMKTIKITAKDEINVTRENEKFERDIYVVRGTDIEEMTYAELLDEVDSEDKQFIQEHNNDEVYSIDCEKFETKEEALEYCNDNEIDVNDIEHTEEHTLFEIRCYEYQSQRSKATGYEYASEQEAEIHILQGKEWYKDNKACDVPAYYDTREDAEQYIIECIADENDIDEEVAESVYKHMIVARVLVKSLIYELQKN